MNNKYINKNTFEILENPNFFEVDEQIADTISILNKKGYRTLYSCAGHNNQSCYKTTTNIDMLEEAKKEFNIYIGKIGKNTFEYFSEAEITNIYIKFNKHYNFSILPDGFTYENAETALEHFKKLGIQDEDIIFGDTIKKTICFFKNNNRLDDEYIENEIKETNKILYEWSKKLPEIEQ